MNKHNKYHQLYIDIAERVAEESHARRRKVGSIIVKDGRIISMGWNGMPSGWDNDCEDRVYANEWSIDNNVWDYEDDDGRPYNLVTKPEVLHAESNAIAKLAKSTESGEESDLYITLSPCIECAKLIHQSGISRVFYKTPYRDDSGIKFLLKSNIEVIQMQENRPTEPNLALDIVFDDKLDSTAVTLLSNSQNKLIKTLKDENEK
jgi:dCMP deaminase